MRLLSDYYQISEKKIITITALLLKLLKAKGSKGVFRATKDSFTICYLQQLYKMYG